MYPVALDLSRIRILLVGSGEALSRRKTQLEEAGAAQLTVHADHLPEAHEIRQAQLLMVTGLDSETSAVLASIARLQGVLVNVEDKNDLCDFHFTGMVKRGDLTLSVSTAGASPTLTRAIKEHLGSLFGEEWSGIVSEIGALRLEWKREGLSNAAVAEKTREWLAVKAPSPLRGGLGWGLPQEPFSGQPHPDLPLKGEGITEEAA